MRGVYIRGSHRIGFGSICICVGGVDDGGFGISSRCSGLASVAAALDSVNLFRPWYLVSILHFELTDISIEI